MRKIILLGIFLSIIQVILAGSQCYIYYSIRSTTLENTNTLTMSGTGVTGSTWDLGTLILNQTPTASPITLTFTRPTAATNTPASNKWTISVVPTGDWLGLSALNFAIKKVGSTSNYPVSLTTGTISYINDNSSFATQDTTLELTESIPITYQGASNVITQTGSLTGTLTFIMTLYS